MLDSGHGGQTKDLDGDEADGYDEGQLLDSFRDSSHPRCSNLSRASEVSLWTFDCFSPLTQVDFQTNGHIVDDVSQ